MYDLDSKTLLSQLVRKGQLVQVPKFRFAEYFFVKNNRKFLKETKINLLTLFIRKHSV
jgi:hypothetical protein